MAARAYIPTTNSTAAREFSYGLIPLRFKSGTSPNSLPRTANTQVLLINQRSRLPSTPTFWTFPKGHAEHADRGDVITSARREVREETGVRIHKEQILYRSRGSTGVEEVERLSPDVPPGGVLAGAWVERYKNPIRKWVKEVRYWVGIVVGDEAGDEKVVIQAKELAGAKWCNWAEAEELITFEEAKTILREVKVCLDAETGGKGAEKL